MMPNLDISKLDAMAGRSLQEGKNVVPASNLLKIKPANQWIAEAKKRPDPKMLFGPLWYEGEVCVFFAGSNLGKSILAVQIGEAIAQGKTSLPPLYVNSSPKKVLFVDCELSDKQFQIRYTEDGNSHEFSKNFLRAEIDKKKLLQGQTVDQLILGAIEAAIQEQKVEAIILDNITALRIDMEKSTEAANLMTGLQHFQEDQAVSILILAHTPKRPPNQPITDNDLSGSKVLMNLADSAFSIGLSHKDSYFRYIKQIKVRNSEKLYGGENVILCEVTKKDNFLAFEFVDFDDEQQHLQQKTNDKSQEEELSIVRQLLKDDYKQREIQKHMGIALGKVNKYCQMIKAEQGDC
jgi:RecA-family ATPase